MIEKKYLQEALQNSRHSLESLTTQFSEHKEEATRKIDKLCEEAGITGEIQSIKAALKAALKKTQSHVDFIQGKIQVLEEVHGKYHSVPIPPGVTHLYGIELSEIDTLTRLKVVHGQGGSGWVETIRILGGDPDRKDWDGEEDPVEEETPSEEEESPSEEEESPSEEEESVEEESVEEESVPPTRLEPPSLPWEKGFNR